MYIKKAAVAQEVERPPADQRIGGSIPNLQRVKVSLGTILNPKLLPKA